jgi:galactokinase
MVQARTFSPGHRVSDPDLAAAKHKAQACAGGSGSVSGTELRRRFESEFGAQPKIFAAPGRVNLIGEHTDYNDGFVLPCAIGFLTRVAIAPRDDRKLVLLSDGFEDRFEFELDKLPPTRLGAWCDYVLGVAVTLQSVESIASGANVMVHGEVPIGAGLSSSAAVEVASALAFMSLNGTTFPMPQVARLCQRAENTFVGARVGIMDQFVSCLGKSGHALRLDCRSLDFELVPIPADVRLVICNTMVKHELSGGEYNRRREECDEGVRILRKWYPLIRALRDISPEQFEERAADLPAVIQNRCRHVITENQRVMEGSRALNAGHLELFGKLMRASHASLRDLYEVSCAELDLMVECAEGLPGFWGGRMTGGGFGGCTVNIVDANRTDQFVREIKERYHAQTSIQPDVYVCAAADGASAELAAHR